MGIVTGRALAVLGGLMPSLCFFKKIIVAAETDLPLTSFHLYRESRFMTLTALLVFVRRMGIEMRFGSGDDGTLNGLGFV